MTVFTEAKPPRTCKARSASKKPKDVGCAYYARRLCDGGGYPTSYLGHALTWERGRQLKSFDGNTYTYNANGIRTSKTVDGVKHEYVLDGTKILREVWDGNTLIPLYDNEDGVCGIVYNGTPYYFVKNLQGDVIAIANARGEVVTRYSYDAWGVPTIVSDTADGIGNINPFRYRGYYYDAEIAKYYLQSRYYDAQTGRFVNGDEVAYTIWLETGGHYNTLSYCGNDSVNRSDRLGLASFSNTKTEKSDDAWDIVTKLKILWTTLTYKYTIKKGVISFEFKDNNYWAVLWRRAAKTLSEAMYQAAKSINRSYLKGRTISGLHTELFIHWALYKVGIKKSRTQCADMGGLWGEGYDSNAWVFEAANIINLVAKINIYKSGMFLRLLRDLIRYF